MSKNILVTGGDSGIGLALCKLLVKDHDCYVYLGSQDPTSGNNALKTIFQEVPGTYNQIQIIQIDVGDEQSCAAAAKTLEVNVEKVHLHAVSDYKKRSYKKQASLWCYDIL